MISISNLHAVVAASADNKDSCSLWQ